MAADSSDSWLVYSLIIVLLLMCLGVIIWFAMASGSKTAS